MNLMETKTRSGILNFITGAATANSEKDVVDALSALMHPVDSREEMGSIFEENLGYNPIVAYDVMDIDHIIDDVLQGSSDIINRLVTANRAKLAERSMAIFNASREEHLQLCVVKAANELFGTSDAEAIAMAIGCDITDVIDLSGPASDGDEEEDEENFIDPDMGASHPDPDDEFLFGDDDDDEE